VVRAWKHYFIMTPTKKNLHQCKCIKSLDLAQGAKLLDKENLDEGKLREFATKVAAHLGLPTEFTKDQGIMAFDFSDRKYVDHAMTFKEAAGCDPLPVFFAGDALLEPFWPTGLGCIRGFFSAWDSLTGLQLWVSTKDRDKVVEHCDKAYQQLRSICEHESAKKFLKEGDKWALDPATRYRYF
jgi:hypothetical protein